MNAQFDTVGGGLELLLRVGDSYDDGMAVWQSKHVCPQIDFDIVEELPSKVGVLLGSTNRLAPVARGEPTGDWMLILVETGIHAHHVPTGCDHGTSQSPECPRLVIIEVVEDSRGDHLVEWPHSLRLSVSDGADEEVTLGTEPLAGGGDVGRARIEADVGCVRHVCEQVTGPTSDVEDSVSWTRTDI